MIFKKAKELIKLEWTSEVDILANVVELAKGHEMIIDYKDINWKPDFIENRDSLVEWLDEVLSEEVEGALWDVTYEAFVKYLGSDEDAMYITMNAGDLFDSVMDRLRGNGYVEIVYKNLPGFDSR